ncbi:uncharacterized protein SOCE26_039140 [Sorangium cellulosum]|uniref:Uncharacterized protein n=1 Tax=Sorangium cellulosum TaxID=56 RepID=A0A2L0ET55_SORCE|nr:hypothetical protein [Sorangium cellulosum]AUX42481.1 uncharacterized protein SOCE26_039140 [Sorangium cellulosum]
MGITVVLFDEAGTPLPEGLRVELLRGAEVVGEARIGGGGTVTFEVDAAGPLAVRLRAGVEAAPRLPES